jgi:hypothetical protein
MVLDAIPKQKIPEVNHHIQTIAVPGGNIIQSFDSIMDLCIPQIDEDMDSYYEKIESLKRSHGKDCPAFLLITQGLKVKRKAPPEALALHTIDLPKKNLADKQPRLPSLNTSDTKQLNNDE